LTDVACADVDVGSTVVRLGPSVRRGADGAVSSPWRPRIVVVLRQAATVVSRQQPQQLRTNGQLFIIRIFSIFSVLKVFLNDMRYINARFTYLLTYLLSIVTVCRRINSHIVCF